jgi:phosphatidylserine decarboxylase
MDPFVIVSFGKKTFRTKVIRHCLNPVFNERLIFQVMKTEQNYQIYFNVYDRDKLSSNDFVAESLLPVSDLISNGPTPNPETGLYQVPEPWKDPEALKLKPKRQDSKLLGILSRSNSSKNLAAKESNGKGSELSRSSSATNLSLLSPINFGVKRAFTSKDSGTTTPSVGTSTLQPKRSLSSTSLSDMPGTSP